MLYIHKIIPILSAYLLLQLPVKGQELLTPPPAKLLTTIPFHTFSGGVILLRAQLDNIKDTLNFILDTGSGGISLDSITAAYYKIPSVPSNLTIRGIAGIKTVRFANNHTLILNGLRTDSLNFHINDYDLLTSVYGAHIDGIIGYSFFSRYIVNIDYDSSVLRVYSKGSFKYPKGGSMLTPLIPTIPIQSGQVTDNRTISTRFYFDIGAGLCLLLSDDFVSDSALFSPRKKMVNTLAEGLGGKAEMKMTVLKEFRLGPYRFKKVPVFVFDDQYNVTAYPSLAGLLGNDLLKRFNAFINYEKRQIYLVPNKRFREPFDYAYSGLSIYYIDGKIVVTDIIKGSPADEAGFKDKDVIISINNNISNNIQEYKSMLLNTGEKLRIVILRKGGPETLILKVKNILKMK